MTRFTLIFLFFLSACGNSDTAPADPGAASPHAGAAPTGIVRTEAPVPLAGCFEMVFKRDSATLRLTVQDTTVSGLLVYKWHERDGNTGTIAGVIRDSLIWANYTFQSEGLTSIREVVFKIRDTTLVPAYGELSEVNGRLIFTDRNNLHFTDDHPFVKVPCP